jgi:hypothetical protein
MRLCVSCNKDKEDKEFASYHKKFSGRNGMFKKKNKCMKCDNESREGVSPDIYGNGISLKSQAFVRVGIDAFTMKNFSDCAINEMGLSYDEFENIPGLDD